MEIDITQFLAAIIENEGGVYHLPLDVFQRVLEAGDTRALAIEGNEAQDGFVLALVDTADIPEDEDDGA